MANLSQYGYNEEQVEVQTGYEDLPVGKYKVEIVESEEKVSKAGANYIALTMQVRGGEHDGRLFFENLNIAHSNPDVVNMAFRTVKQITMAQGKSNIKDTSELHFTPFLLEIAVSKKGNRFNKYSSLDGAAPTKAETKPEPAAPQAPAAKEEKMPWE